MPLSPLSLFYLSLSLTESTRRTRRRRWGWQGRRSSKGCQKSSSRVRKRRRPRAPRARARRPARAARAAARGMSGGWQRGSRGLRPWRSLLLPRRRRRWRPRERRRRRPSCCGGTGVFFVFFGEKVEQRERGREVSDDRRGAYRPTDEGEGMTSVLIELRPSPPSIRCPRSCASIRAYRVESDRGEPRSQRGGRGENGSRGRRGSGSDRRRLPTLLGVLFRRRRRPWPRVA